MRLNDLPKIMIISLLCTILIEVLVAIILGIRNKKDLLNVVLVNFMTNPLVVSLPVYIMVRVGLNARYVVTIVLEILTVIAEGIVYKKYFKFDKINSFVISFILNFSSYFIGKIINYLIY